MLKRLGRAIGIDAEDVRVLATAAVLVLLVGAALVLLGLFAGLAVAAYGLLAGL